MATNADSRGPTPSGSIRAEYPAPTPPHSSLRPRGWTADTARPELAAVADLFAAFGMLPVGYYDLRSAASPIPVVSTAFRPIDANELARNPFRVFTSMLATDDPRYFDAGLRTRVRGFLARRQL